MSGEELRIIPSVLAQVHCWGWWCQGRGPGGSALEILCRGEELPLGGWLSRSGGEEGGEVVTMN